MSEADLKTFVAHRCYGTSVITGLTAQNTLEIQGVHSCPPEFANQLGEPCIFLLPNLNGIMNESMTSSGETCSR